MQITEDKIGILYLNVVISVELLFQMVRELNGMLDGNVSSVTGENVKPAYGGELNAFLDKVIKPIYEVIAEVRCHFRP